MRALLVVVALLGPGLQVQSRAHITDGPAGETAQTQATFAFEADEPTPLSTVGFECRLDGAAWAACTSPQRVDGLGGGPHSFAVRATGALADPTPDERTWTVTQRTEVVPSKPNPVVQPPHPVEAPARVPRRRDAGGCAYGGNEPGEVRAARLRAAVLCLVNAQRAARELQPVERSAPLELSATRYVRAMVRRRFFAHETPSGRASFDRARRAGYLRGARYWTVGEILAWLVDPRPTAAAVVKAWMDSPGHRKVILRANLRDAGVGIARGNPRTRAGGATFAVEFGRRD
jgi:uncharacterized protein YkwD